MSTPPAKPPEILDKIVDLVLAHRPKAQQKLKATKKQKKIKSARQSINHNLAPWLAAMAIIMPTKIPRT